MIEHYLVPIGSTWWLGGWIILSIYLTVALGVGSQIAYASRANFEKVWGLLILVFMLYTHLHQVIEGRWFLSDSLPLQLCDVSRILAVLLLLFRQKWAFPLLFFWGMVGGFHAILTPESPLGGDTFFLVEYYISHASIIVVPMYMIFVNGYQLHKWSWLKAFGWNQLIIAPIMLINYLFDGNYMFLASPPKVDNPFVVGEFPYHIIGFEAAAIIHYLLLVMLFYTKIEKVKLVRA